MTINLKFLSHFINVNIKFVNQVCPIKFLYILWLVLKINLIHCVYTCYLSLTFVNDLNISFTFFMFNPLFHNIKLL